MNHFLLFILLHIFRFVTALVWILCLIAFAVQIALPLLDAGRVVARQIANRMRRS